MSNPKKFHPTHTPGILCWIRPTDATAYECPEHFRLYRATTKLLLACQIALRGKEPYPGYIKTILKQAIAEAEGR